jgi:hypothetical protein
MFSKEEASKIRHNFWTTFGRYMQPVPSAEGLPINWVNYKTGVKPVKIRTEVTKQNAIIRLEIVEKDESLAELYYEQLRELKLYFTSVVGHDWNWEKNDESSNDSCFAFVEKRLPDVSVFREEDWPAIIEFLKQHLILLDEFWSDARHTFLSLG